VQQPPTTIEGTLRSLRLIHVALMVSMLLYVYIMWMIPAKSSETLDPTFLLTLDLVGISSVGVAKRIRSKCLRPAFETLRTKPDDAASLGRWRVGVIVSDALAEAVVLYGFVVHLLGGTISQVAPFFSAGLAAMVFWWPQQP
jgi:hypothetical protein